MDAEGEDDAPAPSLMIENLGTIVGGVGINHDLASVAVQTIVNEGTIEGTQGTAILFAPGQGASTLTLRGESRIIGDVLFGGASDTLIVEDITSGLLINSVFDGGLGDDLVDFTGFELGDVLLTALMGDILRVDLEAGNGDRLMGEFRGFETFRFAGGPELTQSELSQVAPIPLPGTLPLILAGLGGLAALRRRR